jgi:CRISPR-associated endonuclease/helicase Cas3
MMVIFTSRSEKKTLYTVRRILDSFADRIGNDTWKTVITAEGLLTVKTLLRKNATKSMAVSCHWIRSRSRSELVWIVGNRDKFNEEGIVPVNSTLKNITHGEWENGWRYLPVIKSLAAVAGLLHDWGKSSDLFQQKLRNKSFEADPFRHEWISCKLMEALVIYSGVLDTDSRWLELFAENTLDIPQIESIAAQHSGEDSIGKLISLPPIASVLVWLILSHHRVPNIEKNKYENTSKETFWEMLHSIDASWGYENTHIEKEDAKWDLCFTFHRGILFGNAAVWLKNIKKWSERLLSQQQIIIDIMAEPEFKKSFRLVLEYARLCLMLGDHYSSSLPKVTDSKKISQWAKNELWANTDQNGVKQYLEEHLVNVSHQALKIAHQLPVFYNNMEKAYDVKFLKKKGPIQFRWQDHVVEKIKVFRKDHENNQAYFIVNMASTGCGKTIANAKIMQAISDDEKSLRYILALGLRTLTLQTGDEYRERIGLDASELAVLIGSSAIKELHEQEKHEEPSISGVIEELLAEDLDYIDTCSDNQTAFLDIFFNGKNGNVSKNKAFLYKPVLVATIDHMMGATETTRGGRYILPFLRLMSSDLVIDEIDDFDKKDLIAIARLVHLAGMFGRNAVLSSATIPPDLAEGMYRAYVEGLACYNSFFIEPKSCNVILCDEFKSKIDNIKGRNPEAYQKLHNGFIEKRIKCLEREPVRRKGYIVECMLSEDMDAKSNKNSLSLKETYFDTIRSTIEKLHDANYVVDKQTGKKISFGVVRVANIQPCVALSLYFMRCTWTDGYAIHMMTYHSRQILLLRHEQEQYLDAVLKRKYESAVPVDFTDPVIRKHIDAAKGDNVIFFVVATPVEEIGRDHDFDWALVEPSSYRSIIQLAGRILRHRKINHAVNTYNMAIMQYNIKGLQGKKQAFNCPGYEQGKYYLASHNLKDIVDEVSLEKRIDAVLRIKKASRLDPQHKLIDLEHSVMQDFNSTTEQGPQCLHGWIQEYWWLTALPQCFNRFRESYAEDIKLYACYDEGTIDFCEYTAEECVKRTDFFGIHAYKKITNEMGERLWIVRDYISSLKKQVKPEDERPFEVIMKYMSLRFGELTIPDPKGKNIKWQYSDQLGLFKEENSE